MKSIKVSIGMLLAAITLAGCVSAASATRLSITSRSIRAVWSSLEFSTGASPWRCRLTLEGTLHESTFAKIAASLIGYVTAAQIGHPCSGAQMWVYNGTEVNEVLTGTFSSSFPWHITYEGFNGTLPTPSGIRILILLARFMLAARFLGITILCAYRTSPTQNLTGIANLGSGGVVQNVEASSQELRSEGAAGCPMFRARSQAGDGRLTVLGTSDSISLTLI